LFYNPNNELALPDLLNLPDNDSFIFWSKPYSPLLSKIKCGMNSFPHFIERRGEILVRPKDKKESFYLGKIKVIG